MLNIFWLILTIALAGTLLRLRSPLIFVLPYLLVPVVFTDFGGVSEPENLIIALWLATLLVAALYLDGRGIALDNYIEVNASHATLNIKTSILLAVGIALLAVAMWFWFTQAGIDEFSSRKRTGTASNLYNIANAIVGLFILHAVACLSLSRFNIRNPNIIMACVTITAAVIIGYLSSSRSLFVVPLTLIFAFRICKVSSWSGRIRIFAALAVCAAIGIYVMAIIAASRSGNAGFESGLEQLSKQASNADRGYGISPGKDAKALAYSDFMLIQRMPTALLGGFYGVVPRAVWPSKPTYVSTGPIVGAYVFRAQYRITMGAGMPVSLPAELTLAFGPTWFYIGFLAILILVVMTAALLIRFPSLIFASILFWAGLCTQGLPKSQAEFGVDVISIILLSFCGLKIRNVAHVTTRASVRRRGQALPAAPIPRSLDQHRSIGRL